MAKKQGLETPCVIINFKTYASGTGKEAEKLADICGKFENVAVCAQATDILACSKKAVTFSQHIDPVEQGKKTGFITAEAVKAAGAFGTILNHAEHKIPKDVLKASVEKAHANGLVVLVCADSTKEAEEIARICEPDYIAIEPPELIGGNISVSKANPKIITSTIAAVQKIKNIPIICGAGVSGTEDVKVAIKLGAVGVLVANFVMGAQDKKKAVKDLAQGLG